MMLMINSMTLSLIFMFLNHPISLGIVLLMQTILISLMSSFYTYSFWLSYILFLVMIGGVLILFTYITSIASNETFMFSNKLLIMIIMMFLVSIILSMIDKTFMFQLFKNNDMLPTNNIINFIKDNDLILNKIYNKPSNLISLILINYLFLTLIIVVKITNINYGPLRQKF
uniref:NADH-ubiquinone oxidoreductase chain 6 n=1 Tax=Contacyphon variabilis TaxID=877938 RepID=A0A191ZR78_9COLE|nr:NADH dehydrogenase subunit 6 [Contacyphon variabilis]